MKHIVALSVFGMMGLSGCGALQLWPKTSSEAETAEIIVAGSSETVARPAASATTVDEFDTTTEAQKAAARTVSASVEKKLGVSVASLGSPSEPGFWIKTPLVKTTGPGRVFYPASGESVQVTLIPIEGPATGGSQLSLAAFRLIGAPLTGLPQVEVFSVN